MFINKEYEGARYNKYTNVWGIWIELELGEGKIYQNIKIPDLYKVLK